MIPGTAPPETEKAMNNDYLASQLIADRQAAVAADLAHRAQLKDARATHKTSAASAHRQARVRRVIFGRLAQAGT